MLVFKAILILPNFMFAMGHEEAPLVNKPFTISMLNLIPFTGEEPAKGEACRLSSQIVADAVNARSDILPNYRIEMDFQDEFVGRWAAKQVISFAWRTPEDPTVSRSPIVVGPQYSTGCKAMGPVLRQVNLIALSTWCTAPVLEDHSRYPELYLNQGTGIARAFAVLRFIHDIGHWNRFAIITNAENINDYGTALFLQDTAYRLGYNVTSFDMVTDGLVDEGAMVLLKQSGVRILVIATCFPELLTSVLCEAYRQGMTGKNYVFIADIDTNLDPLQLDDVIYPGCTKEIVFAQLKMTFYIGATAFPTDEERAKKSHFGYTWPQFEEMFNELTDSTELPDDLSKYLCHDATVKAVMALDDAEKKLNKMNLTLRDYERFPEMVMKVANESALHINVAGLRTKGNMSYSSSGKVASDLQVAMHWTPENQSQNIVAVNALPKNGSDVDLDNFECQVMESAMDKFLVGWKPPNDYPLTVHVLKKIPFEIFIAVSVLCAILAILQVALIAWTIRTANSRAGEDMNLIHTFPFSKCAGYLGCIMAQAASVLFLVPEDTPVMATYRIALLVIAASLTHSVLIIRVVIILQSKRAVRFSVLPVLPANHRTSATTAGTLGTYRTSIATKATYRLSTYSTTKRIIPECFWIAFDRTTVKASAAVVLANIVVLASVICSAHKVDCSQKMAGLGVYFKDRDTVFETWVTRCTIPEQIMHYLLAISFLHFVLLFASVIFGYKLGRCFFVVHELPMIRAAAVNEFFLFGLTMAIVAIIEDPISQNITIAFAGLFSSAISTATWILPSVTTPKPTTTNIS